MSTITPYHGGLAEAIVRDDGAFIATMMDSTGQWQWWPVTAPGEHPYPGQNPSVCTLTAGDIDILCVSVQRADDTSDLWLWTSADEHWSRLTWADRTPPPP